MITIESAQNDTFKTLLSLTGAKGLKKEGIFLLSGEKLVGEFLKNSNLEIVFEILTPSMTAVGSQLQRQVRLGTDLFSQIDVLGTHFNILALKQPTMPLLDDVASYKPRGIEAVIPIGDPGNLGALLRSCEAFGVPRVILTQESAHPFLPKSVKASAGSVLRLPLLRGPALSAFPDDCIALDMKGLALNDFIWPENGLLVVGEEGPGLGRSFRQLIRIPTEGVESLNAVVAASIALAAKGLRKGVL